MLRREYEKLRLSPNMKRGLLCYEPVAGTFKRLNYLHQGTLRALYQRQLLSSDSYLLLPLGEAAWRYTLREFARG